MKTTTEEKQEMNASEFKQYLIKRLAVINQKLQAMLDSQTAETHNNSNQIQVR